MAEKTITTVTLYSQDCLNCLHLTDFSRAVPHNKCHYSKGNKYCPAKELRFVVTGNLDKQAKEIYKSMIDPKAIDALAKKMQRLNKLPETTRREIMSKVKKLLKES